MGREEHCKQIRTLWGVLPVSWPHWVCPCSWCVCLTSLHCLGSRLLCQELPEAGPVLSALPRSKPLRFRFSACVLCPSPVQAAQVTRCLAGCDFTASPIPAAPFSGCTTGTPSQVCRMSPLGSWSLAATLPADVGCPESQGVLVSNEACLQFGRWCLSGAAIALFRLWLPLPICLRRGMGCSTAS